MTYKDGYANGQKHFQKGLPLKTGFTVSTPYSGGFIDGWWDAKKEASLKQALSKLNKLSPPDESLKITTKPPKGG